MHFSPKSSTGSTQTTNQMVRNEFQSHKFPNIPQSIQITYLQKKKKKNTAKIQNPMQTLETQAEIQQPLVLSTTLLQNTAVLMVLFCTYEENRRSTQ